MLITVKEFPNKSFSDQGEVFDAFREHKAFLYHQKKSIIKTADAVDYFPIVGVPHLGKSISAKELNKDILDPSVISTLKMSLAINTTNLLDSHSDVHLPGLWNKSLKETKSRYHLQEHQMKFDKIITEEVKASAKMISWKDLGADYAGDTQVLLYEVSIQKERNPFMFEQYAKGYVKNHSVGMRYGKIYLALNSDSRWDEEEKATWDKYIDQVANKDAAEAQGYFWAVTEAREIEGSAVPLGSNPITPTISIEEKGAVEDTPKEKGAAKDTPDSFFSNLI